MTCKKTARKKLSWSMRLLCAGAILIVSPALLAQKYADNEVRHYKVVDLEERGEDSIKINAQIEQVVSYSSTMRYVEKDGDSYYLMERIENTKEGDKTIWKIFHNPDDLSLRRIEKTIVSRTGKTVAHQWMDYQDKMFGYPKNIYHVYTITSAIRTMDLKPGARHDINLLLDIESAPWHMFIDVEKEETITVPAGTFQCYLITLDPDYKSIMGKWAWTSGLIKRFVPEYKFWVDKAPPHGLVRFQGTFGPVGGSPPQAHELTKVEKE